MISEGELADVTIDAFLGGRVEAVQPAKGHHRSGLEAVLLGAAMPGSFVGAIVDLGAGVGVAGLCAAARCLNARITLVERQSTLVECATATLHQPGNSAIADRVAVAEIDIMAPEAERLRAGLGGGEADIVITNPPFFDSANVSVSPAPGKSMAHVMGTSLDDWFRAASWSLRPGGMVVIVAPAATLVDIFEAIDGRFGAAAILPIHSRAGLPAARVLVGAIKGRSTAPAILPGLVLHGDAGPAFTPGVEAMLREGAGLGDCHPPWQRAFPAPS